MASAKKPPLSAVVAGMGKSTEPSAPPAEDETYSAAVDELADILGVSDVDAFRSAFEAAVMSCK